MHVKGIVGGHLREKPQQVGTSVNRPLSHGDPFRCIGGVPLDAGRVTQVLARANSAPYLEPDSMPLTPNYCAPVCGSASNNGYVRQRSSAISSLTPFALRHPCSPVSNILRSETPAS
jgi:hypothetical protein